MSPGAADALRRSRRALAALAVAALAAAGGGLVAPAPALADEVRDSSWHLGQLKVADAHRVTRGAGVVVAVIDTGIDAGHPDLTGNVLPGFDMIDPANRGRGLRDRNGHGTAVASLIAGHGHGPGNRDGILGIAPDARLLPINIYDERANGAGRGAIAKAIRLAVDQGAEVICVAFAGGFEPGDEAAVEYATSKDVLVVAGVGNSPAVLVQDPAGVTAAVAVTAVDRTGKPATTVRGVPDREIDVAAPGAEIRIAMPGGRYGTSTGTSAATAIVAGTVALIRASHPQARRNEQLARLVWTSTEAGAPGRDAEYGWGLVNPVDAVTTEPREPAGASAAPSRSAAPPAAAPDEDDGGGGLDALPYVLGGTLVLVLLGLGVGLIAARRRARAPSGS